MKKLSTFLTVLLAVVLLSSACSSGSANKPPAATSKLNGSSRELLDKLIKSLKVEPLQSMEEDLTAETAKTTLGLDSNEYEAKIENACVSQAMISSQAHILAMIKCKDVGSAKEIQSALQSKFDVHRWVCVMPEKAYAVTAEQYVLLVASFSDYAAAAKDGFTELAGSSIGTFVDIPTG